MPTFTLNFSRPGGQVIASYFLFLHLGRPGYRAVHDEAYEVAQHIAIELARFDQFEVVFDGDPERGIPAVSWRATDPSATYSLFDVAEIMRSHGWLVPAYPLPADRTDEVVQRIVVRHGVSIDMADLMLADLRSSLDRLEARPPSRPAGSGDGMAFNHDATPRVPAEPARS
jgi:glutamate decarboxylase